MTCPIVHHQITKSFIANKALSSSDYVLFSRFEYSLPDCFSLFNDSSMSYSSILNLFFVLTVPPHLFNRPSSINFLHTNSLHTNSLHTNTLHIQSISTTISEHNQLISLAYQLLVFVVHPSFLSNFKGLTVSIAGMEFWVCCVCKHVNSAYQSICDRCSHSKCTSCEGIDIP